ncbi:unnamed protein product, partial [Brenthis ino]
MAFKKKENIFFIGLLIVTAITLPLVATQNIDCKGKAFHCVNSTHFKICVDLGGGVSTTVDDFLIPCPKSTVCKDSNYFECEYHPTTTLKPTQQSEVTNDQISETPTLENFDIISTFNSSISDIELSEVIISTTPTPEFSSTTLTIDSVIDYKNVTSVISDSAIYNNINTTVTKVSLNNEDLLSTTTEKVILDNTELNFTKPINYTSNLLSSEKIQSTDNNLTDASLNTYLSSDVTEVYIKNKSTPLSNTLTNHIDEDNFNHTSSKNESFSVPSSKNISVNKTTNISSGVSTTEIEPNSSTTKKIINKLYDEVTEQNTVASSINILSTTSEDQFSPFNLLQKEISITADRNVNIEYQEKLFTAAQNDISKENTTPESILVTNSFDDPNKNNILASTEKNTTKSKYESSVQNSPTFKNIFYDQSEYMATTTETQGYFLKERVVTNINDAYIDSLSILKYESTTESNSNYETGRSREELNISKQNVSETFNYSLSDSQLSMSTASNEYISFKGNPLQNTIYEETNNVSSLPSTVSKSETAINTLNNETKPIDYYNYTSKYNQNITLTQTESISKTDRIETTEFTRDNLHTPTTISPTEFSNQLNLVQNSLVSTIQKPNNSKEFAGHIFIELQANTTDSYSTLHDENPLQSMSTTSIIKNTIHTEPVNIKLPAINVLSEINRTNDATTTFDIDNNKDIKNTDVNAGNINNYSAVIDKPVGIHIPIINVSDVATTAVFNSSKEDKTNTETLMYDSEKISTTVSILVAAKYPSSTDLNVTSNIEILNNFEFRDKTLTAGTTEPNVRTSEINDPNLWIFKNTMIRDAENTNIDKSNKINTIITEEKHTADVTVSDISTSGGTDVSMQIYNNVSSQEEQYMYINNDINLRKVSTEVKLGDKVAEFYVKNTESTPKSFQTQNSTTTMVVVDAIINNNNEKNILTFNNIDTTLREHISDEKLPEVNTVKSTDVNRMEYNNNVGNVNVNSSNKISMQIFNSTNEVDEKYVTTIAGLVVNDSTSSNLNEDSPITDKKLIDLNFENIYKAPNNVDLNGKELNIDTAVSAINGSQANITIYESDDISKVNFADVDNVIQTTDKIIQTYDSFKVKHDKSIADSMEVSFINGNDITVHAHKNILLNEANLKTDITKANGSSTEASVNSLTTEAYYYNNTREMTFIANDAVTNDGDIVNINDKTLPTMVYDVSLNIRADTNVQQNDTILEKKMEKDKIITQSNDLKTQTRNNTEVNQLKSNAYVSADVNITIDSEYNIQTNNSINKVDFFANTIVSDVITQSIKIAMLNPNIDEVKEMKLTAGAAIPDLNFIEENITKKTYNNTLTKQLNIADNIMLDKNLTKDSDKTMQNHYNIDPTVTKHMKFSLDKTKANVTKTLSNSIAATNLENYNNSEVNLYFTKDRAVNMNFANSTNKRIQTANATEPKEITLRIYNINATATDNINMQTYNKTRDNQLNFKIVQDLSNNKGVNVNTQVFNKTDAEIMVDITMVNMTVKEDKMFNITLANENITEKNDIYVQIYSDTPVESSKFIAEHTILGFNVTQNTDVNLNTGTTVDLFNIKISATSPQTYNNTQMQDMISVSDITVLNKSEGNTKENNIIKVKGINIQSYLKDTENQTYPKDIENQIIKTGKLRSNQTSTISNNSQTPFISKLEESTSFYPIIVKEIETDSGEITKNKPNLAIAHSSNLDSDNMKYDLRNPLDIINSKKTFEAVTLSSSEIKVHVTPKVAPDAPYINDFIVLSGSVIGNSNYNIENTLENLSTKSRPLSKLEFKNGYETLKSNNNKLLNNKTVSEMNGDKSNFNRIFTTSTTTPSKIKPIEIIDHVKDIKVNEEVSEDDKYIQMPPSNKNKQWIVTNTEKSALNQSDYFVQHINVSLPISFTCNVGSRGKYSDKNDCNKFYICIGKLTPIIGRCSGDTVFSEITKQCTKNLSHCVRNNQFKCLAEGRFIDVLSNNYYYICANNSKGFVRLKLKCQEGYRLNTDSIHCTSKPSSIEDDSKNTSEKSTKEKPSSESEKSKKNFACETEGLFEFPDDSRKYFLCTKKSKSEFRRKIKKCDSDEVFDKDKQKCVDEDSHDEMNGDKSNFNRIFKTNTTTPSKIKPIQIIDNVKNIKINEEVSEDDKYIQMPPSNNNKQWIVTDTEKSVLNQSDYFVEHINVSLTTAFICNEGSRGKYSDKNDCNKFYICIGKLTPIIGTCPGDTVFSEINKQCTKNLSHCIRNNQFRCLAEGRFIDILSNNFYYICAKNSKGFVRLKLKCQEGYRLNTDSIHCTSKPSSIEDDSKNTSEKSTKVKPSSESKKSKKNFACEKEGLFEFPDDRRKYFLCTKKSKSEFRRKIKKCDSDEVFDKDKQKCVDEDSHEGK